MDPKNTPHSTHIKKIALLSLVIILATFLLGWWIGRSDEPTSSNSQPANTQTAAPSSGNSETGTEIASLISYSLPGGWKENSCPGKDDVYIAPEGNSVNCEMEPRAPIVITLDSEGATDCNQLQNVQNVSKHTCASEYINNMKSLKAETVYSKDSSYKKDTAIHAYYIDTGKGVVKVEYIHDPNNNEHQAGFEKLAKSVKSKS